MGIDWQLALVSLRSYLDWPAVVVRLLNAEGTVLRRAVTAACERAGLKARKMRAPTSAGPSARRL